MRRPHLGSGHRVRPVERRRRLVVALGLAWVVALVVIAIALGGGSGGDRSARASTAAGNARGTTSGGGGSPGGAAPRPAPSAVPAFTADLRATALAARLPLERQVAQLFVVSLTGTSTDAVAGLGNVDWGGVMLGHSNFVSASQVGAVAAAVIARARSAKRTPPLIAAPQEGGADTAFKGLAPASEPDVAASGRPGFARSQAELAARQLRALHVNMTIAPLADVDIPDGPLSGRLFSGEPAVVARYAAAEVAGYNAGHLISAAGHFPGSGAASADPDQMTATVGGALPALRSHDLIPFAAIAATVPVIMMSNAAYAAFDGVTPASLLPQAVALLRDSYRYPGVVMSDDLDATLQPTGAGPGSVAVQALQAGDDLLFISGPPSEHQAAYAAVLAAARRSATIRTLVHNALLRVLSLKARFGLLGPSR